MMYLLVFVMATMRCDDTSANISRQYEEVMKASTPSGGVSLTGDAILSAHETGSQSTHVTVSSEYPDIDHKVDKMALTGSNMLSSYRDKDCEICVSDSIDQSLTEILETKDGTNCCSSSPVNVSTTAENVEKLDLDVGHGEKKSIFTVFEGIHSSVMSSETKEILSKAGKKFIKSVNPQELLAVVEITTNFATETSEGGTSRISKETTESKPVLRLKIPNPGNTFPDVSGQISNIPTSVLFSKINSNANETVKESQNNEHGHSSASWDVPTQNNATSCNETVLEDCNPETNVVALHSETLKLTDSAIKPTTLQHPSRTSAPILKFPDVPEGEEFHIQELGLSEGPFLFSYIGSFLSWIQPHDFPVGKRRVEYACKG
jgi:predicted transglutaminase-like cysteine proteinase